MSPETDLSEPLPLRFRRSEPLLKDVAFIIALSLLAVLASLWHPSNFLRWQWDRIRVDLLYVSILGALGVAAVALFRSNEELEIGDRVKYRIVGFWRKKTVDEPISSFEGLYINCTFGKPTRLGRWFNLAIGEYRGYQIALKARSTGDILLPGYFIDYAKAEQRVEKLGKALRLPVLKPQGFPGSSLR